MSFAEKIRKLREDEALSLSQLAEKIGVTKQMLNRYEMGLATPSLLVLKNISEYFGVTADYLIKNED